MKFCLEPDDGEIDFSPEVVILAGHTGREPSFVEAHIRELEAQGVRPPASVPEYTIVPASLLIQSSVVQTPSSRTSGEAEFAVLVDDDTAYVTIASDHTDRAAEQINVQLSKRSCATVMGRSVWRLDDVEGRWDQLMLRGWTGDDSLELYQEAQLSALQRPRSLLAMLPWNRRPARFVVLGGTVPAIAGIRIAAGFRAELADPTTGRALSLEYRTEILSPLALPPALPGLALMSILRRVERRLE